MRGLSVGVATRRCAFRLRQRQLEIDLRQLLRRYLARPLLDLRGWGIPRPLRYFGPDLCAIPSSNGLIKSSGNGNTIVEALPLLDMSAKVCK